VGRRVAVVGLTCAFRRVETKRGEPMLFVTVADASGLAEGTLFTGAYRAWGPAARATIVRLEGRVEEALDAITLNVDRVIALDGSAPPVPGTTAGLGSGAPAHPAIPPRDVPRSRNGVSVVSEERGGRDRGRSGSTGDTPRGDQGPVPLSRNLS
jgi:hypothetical protein